LSYYLRYNKWQPLPDFSDPLDMDIDSFSMPKSNEKKSKKYQNKPKCPEGTFPRKSTGECKSDVVMPNTLKEAYNIKDNTGFVQASQGKICLNMYTHFNHATSIF